MIPKNVREPKSALEQNYEDARDAARAEVRRLTRRLTDALYVDIDEAFVRAIHDDELIEVKPDLAKIKRRAVELLEAGE